MINYSPLLLEDVKFYGTFYWRCCEGEHIQVGNLHWLIVANHLKPLMLKKKKQLPNKGEEASRQIC